MLVNTYIAWLLLLGIAQYKVNTSFNISICFGLYILSDILKFPKGKRNHFRIVQVITSAIKISDSIFFNIQNLTFDT